MMRTLAESQEFLNITIELCCRADPTVLDAMLETIDDESENRGS